MRHICALNELNYCESLEQLRGNFGGVEVTELFNSNASLLDFALLLATIHRGLKTIACGPQRYNPAHMSLALAYLARGGEEEKRNDYTLYLLCTVITTFCLPRLACAGQRVT